MSRRGRDSQFCRGISCHEIAATGMFCNSNFDLLFVLSCFSKGLTDKFHVNIQEVSLALLLCL